jgi:hypothetical protein
MRDISALPMRGFCEPGGGAGEMGLRLAGGGSADGWAKAEVAMDVTRLLMALVGQAHVRPLCLCRGRPEIQW